MKAMSSFGQATEFLEKSGDKSPAFGIDLGTTNSCIGVIRAGTTPVIIELEDGRKTMPSCIMWKGKDKFVVGQEAYRERYKPSAVYSIKRLMGSDEKVTLRYGTKTLEMTPVEVSAQILKGLVEKASTHYKNIKSVVITVPAYFDSKQVQDTVEAGKLAGLEVLSILREPTAAILPYGLQEGEKQEETALVYDLGGGTFDVTAVRITRSSGDSGDLSDLEDLYGELPSDSSKSTMYTVLDVDGDSKLGGDDIDHEMYKIVERYLKQAGVNTDLMPKVEKEKLLLRLERLKKDSGIGSYELKMKFKLKNGENVDTSIEISPSDFIEAARVIYNKTKKKMKAVLSRVGQDKIDTIILVGGSTKSTAIKSFLAKDFPDVSINDAFNPDESVALGAAVKAKEEKFGGKDVEVFDVIPMSIGVLSEDHVKPIIKRNQRVPYQASSAFTTTSDNQEVVRVAVYQGNSSLVEECTYLGSLVIDQLPKREAGKVTISVTLTVDSNGLLKCKVNIENIEREIELVNLFKGTEDRKVLTPREKRATKWKSFGMGLKDTSAREEVLSLVERYLAEEVDEKEVSAVVRKYADLSFGVSKPEARVGQRIQIEE